ncbi:MAG: Branched-chain amino acid transport system permease protein [Modestobacter sp.]|jgi:branched-subunit amino acid ABC-type transport system permease component|nr:Branched-chain amino acid transport system permease protein [Modestobacter sp.]
MEAVVSFALAVLTLFGFYALLALGMGLIFGQLGVVNVAFGDFVMAGAFVMYGLEAVPFVPRVLIALVLGGALAWAIEKLLLRPLYVQGFLATLLAMWGVGIVLRQTADAVFGSTPASVASPVTGSISVLGVQYPTYRLVATTVSLVVVVAILFVVYRTDFGMRLRATIDNREMASLLGIPPRPMIMATFVFGTVLAVLAGALQAPMLGLTPHLGVAFLAPAFFAVLVGRPGSLAGPLFGAFVVALLSNSLRGLFSETTATLLFYAALIVLIAIRPQGLDWKRPQWTTALLARRPA